MDGKHDFLAVIRQQELASAQQIVSYLAERQEMSL